MRLDKRTGWALGIVIVLGIIVGLALPWQCSSQTLKSVDHVKVSGGYDLVTTVTITDAQAVNIIRALGADKTVGDVKTEIGTETLRAVKRIVEMSESNNKGRWMKYITDPAWDVARQKYEAEEVEKKRIADSIAATQDVGMIYGDDWAPTAYVGKSFSQVYDEVFEVASDPFAQVTQSSRHRPGKMHGPSSSSLVESSSSLSSSNEGGGDTPDPFRSLTDLETSSPQQASSFLSLPSSLSASLSNSGGGIPTTMYSKGLTMGELFRELYPFLLVTAAVATLTIFGTYYVVQLLNGYRLQKV